MAKAVVVYGSDWCPYTVQMVGFLDDLGVSYDYVDVDADPEAEQRIAGWNRGRAIRPTLDLGGDIYVNPDLPELEEELRKRDLLPAGA